MTEKCLGTHGDYFVRTRDGCVLRYPVLKVGDVQTFTFAEGDLPPFGNPDAPKYDIIIEGSETRLQKKRQQKCSHIFCDGHGTKDDRALSASRIGNDNSNECKSAPPVPKKIEGYIGKPKGAKHIMVERGLYFERQVWMRSDTHDDILRKQGVPEDHLESYYGHFVLQNCEDFKNESPSKLDELIISRGHILIKSPAYHCELAGCGIEYSWGFCKNFIRKETPVSTSTGLLKNVMDTFSTCLNLTVVNKFARRANDYRRVLTNGSGILPREEIEKCKKQYRSHRTVELLASSFLTSFSDLQL